MGDQQQERVLLAVCLQIRVIWFGDRLRSAHRARVARQEGITNRNPVIGPHPNIHGAHLQQPRERLPRIGPVAQQGLGPACLARRAVSVKDPPNPNYISIMPLGGSCQSPTPR
jgi:hypothetical protein